jgi:hypothetical protein
MNVDGGAGSLENLVKKVDHGLLLTTMWYIRMVDPNSLLLTGLTRDGVFYLVSLMPVRANGLSLVSGPEMSQAWRFHHLW